MEKKLLAVMVLVIVTSLSIAGCTTTPTTPTVQTTTSPNGTTASAVPVPKSGDLSAKLNDDLRGKNYTLVVPFTRAVNQYGNVVYTGVVQMEKIS